MDFKDQIGIRGERIFGVIITEFCGGAPLFEVVFLGDKHQTTDFIVKLIGSTSEAAFFFVQVRATMSGYIGSGSSRKLNVSVKKSDVLKLKRQAAPTYVVGIDIQKNRGYIIAITEKSPQAISGVPTRNRLNCRSLRALWNEVNDYWKAKSMLAKDSRFSS
jgi:Domain of unknown function (DUF4365)